MDLDTGVLSNLPARKWNRLFGGWTEANWFQVTDGGRTLIYPTETPTGDGYELCVWDVEKGRGKTLPLSLFEPGPQPPNDQFHTDVAAVTADGHMAAIFVHAPYCSIHLVDLTSGVECARWRMADRVFHLSFSPDGRILAVGVLPANPFAFPHVVQFWDVASRRPMATMNELGGIEGWMPDGRFLGRDRRELRGFDGRTGEAVGNSLASEEMDFPNTYVTGHFLNLVERREWPGYVQRIGNYLPKLLFDPDRWKGRSRVIDLTSGQTISDLPIGCFCSPDGRFLREQNPDGTTRIYRVPPQHPGGIVLGLMIAEVALAIAWAAWRRRIRRRNCAVC